MSLPVPSPWSAGVLLLLWLGFVLIAGAILGIWQWWHLRNRNRRPTGDHSTSNKARRRRRNQRIR